jgi:signal transduction histidine kinase
MSEFVDRRKTDTWYSAPVTVVVALLAATGCRILLDPLVGRSIPNGLYLVATVFISWRYGLVPALVTLILGTALAVYLFVEPLHQFKVDNAAGFASLAVAVFLGVCVSFMIESLRMAAAQNARMYRAAHAAETRKDEFLAMLAHELRNPLAPIRNGVYLLKAIAAKEPRIEEACSLLDRQVGHLQRLVDDLLDVSRITRGLITLREADIRIDEIVGAALEISRPLMDERRQRLSVSLPNESIVVHADRVRLTQALANVLNNASKYTDEAGRIWLTVKAEDKAVALSVRDTGVGIAAGNRSRIFDMFVQVDDSDRRAVGGLGIGLTLARRFVEMHHGTIEAHSPGLGLGSEFILRLPAVPHRAESPANRPEPAKPAHDARPLPGARGPSHRVLIIDDNVPSANSTATLLKMWDHEVRVCHDGFAAIEAAREFVPDVVLCDITMPRMDGYLLAGELRRIPALNDARLIAVTGHGRPEDKHRAHEAGFNLHWLKPIDPHELEQLLSV